MSYHQWTDDTGEPLGSFEVFEVIESDHLEPGWYWWPCFPGCLPDGEAAGPFPTQAAALADAEGR